MPKEGWSSGIAMVVTAPSEEAIGQSGVASLSSPRQQKSPSPLPGTSSPRLQARLASLHKERGEKKRGEGIRHAARHDGHVQVRQREGRQASRWPGRQGDRAGSEGEKRLLQLIPTSPSEALLSETAARNTMNTADRKSPWKMWVPCVVHSGLCLYLLCSCPPHIPH